MDEYINSYIASDPNRVYNHNEIVSQLSSGIEKIKNNEKINAEEAELVTFATVLSIERNGL